MKRWIVPTAVLAGVVVLGASALLDRDVTFIRSFDQLEGRWHLASDRDGLLTRAAQRPEDIVFEPVSQAEVVAAGVAAFWPAQVGRLRVQSGSCVIVIEDLGRLRYVGATPDLPFAGVGNPDGIHGLLHTLPRLPALDHLSLDLDVDPGVARLSQGGRRLEFVRS